MAFMNYMNLYKKGCYIADAIVVYNIDKWQTIWDIRMQSVNIYIG